MAQNTFRTRQRQIAEYVNSGFELASGLTVISRNPELLAASLGVSRQALYNIGDKQDPAGLVASCVSATGNGEVVAEGLVVEQPYSMRLFAANTTPSERLENAQDLFAQMPRGELRTCYQSLQVLLGHQDRIG